VYQYDILRGNRGHLGIAAQINVMNTTGTISTVAQVTSTGVHQAASSSGASLLTPIPTVGPEFRLFLTKSSRVFINGQLFGMYFFGYGHLLTTVDYLGVEIGTAMTADCFNRRGA